MDSLKQEIAEFLEVHGDDLLPKALIIELSATDASPPWLNTLTGGRFFPHNAELGGGLYRVRDLMLKDFDTKLNKASPEVQVFRDTALLLFYRFCLEEHGKRRRVQTVIDAENARRQHVKRQWKDTDLSVSKLPEKPTNAADSQVLPKPDDHDDGCLNFGDFMRVVRRKAMAQHRRAADKR